MCRKSKFSPWLYGIAGGACACLIVEFLLQLVEHTALWRVLPVVERELGWPDPAIGYALRPSLEIINVRENRMRVRTNQLGFRDRERSLEKPANTERIIVTGDSFTEALQVTQKETFTQLAEERLNTDRRGGRVEVLNFGMSGAHPIQQLLMLKNRALDFAPDAVIMVISPHQFQASAMTDDSIRPAYVKTGEGFTFGYAFRTRLSQRYRDTQLGRAFFFLMDHLCGSRWPSHGT